MDKKSFDKFAAEIRVATLEEFKALGFGHVGGAMSIIDTLAVLYGGVMNVDPKNPKMEDRDTFILSKGHAGPSLYAALALKGFFDIGVLKTLNQGGSILPSHCDKNLTPGIDMTTGSLGQGISAGIGLALASKMKNKANYSYVMLGDGEMDEGQVWEGALFAAQKKLDNLIVFIDYNKYQLDGSTEEVMDLGDLRQKFADFGWDAQSIDGHDTEAIYQAIENAKAVKGKPHMIVLNTLKGKGCTYALRPGAWNHFMAFTDADSDEAIAAAKQELAALAD